MRPQRLGPDAVPGLQRVEVVGHHLRREVSVGVEESVIEVEPDDAPAIGCRWDSVSIGFLAAKDA